MPKLDELQQTWRNFIVKSIEKDYLDTTVIFADENSPRPAKPYLTLKISGPRRVTNVDSLVYNADRDKFDLHGHRRFTLSIQSYGLGHIDVLDDIITDTDNPDIKSILRSCDIGVENKGNPIDVSGNFANGIEKRGSLDISFITSKIKQTEIGTIESAEISGELETETETKVIDTFTVPEP